MNNKMVHTGGLSVALVLQLENSPILLNSYCYWLFALDLHNNLRHQWKVGISNLKHRELPVLRKIRCEDERSFALRAFNNTAQDQFKCGARRKIALTVSEHV